MDNPCPPRASIFTACSLTALQPRPCCCIISVVASLEGDTIIVISPQILGRAEQILVLRRFLQGSGLPRERGGTGTSENFGHFSRFLSTAPHTEICHYAKRTDVCTTLDIHQMLSLLWKLSFFVKFSKLILKFWWDSKALD